MEQSRELLIINKLGLHARAAAKLVKVAASFNSDIDIEGKSQRVNGKSIMGVMMLAACKGSSIIIHARGSDAEESLDAIEELVNNRFYENE